MYRSGAKITVKSVRSYTLSTSETAGLSRRLLFEFKISSTAVDDYNRGLAAAAAINVLNFLTIFNTVYIIHIKFSLLKRIVIDNRLHQGCSREKKGDSIYNQEMYRNGAPFDIH